MINFAENLRKNTIDYLEGKEIEEVDKKIILKFIYYMGAYCVELGCTEGDILYNDERYKSVYNLFDCIILKKELI